MERNLISIIMPVRNGMPFLVECMKSIIEQTYENWELLVVDDHSEDHTFVFLSRLAQKDKRINIFKNNGHGIIDALKMGYAHSQGAFITRMDADDVMTSDKLQSMCYNLCIQGEGHIALGKVKYFCKGKLGNGYKKYENWLNGLIATGNNYLDIYKECVIPSPCWMVFRDDFEKIGGFDTDVYPEDYDLCFRFYKYGIKCIPSDKVLHYWRDYPERTSRNHSHYSDNRFLNLKVKYFLDIDYNPADTLVIWGCGKKGKKIAKFFIDTNIQFLWITNNYNKIGLDIYGIPIQSQNKLADIPNPQIIIAVASPEGQQEIQTNMKEIGLLKGKQYFNFC